MHTFVFILVVLAISAQPSYAWLGVQGTEKVEVDDGADKLCIDATTDTVSVWLKRLVIEKSVGWPGSEDTVTFLAASKIQKRDSEPATTEVTMPSVFHANVSRFDAGMIVIPMSIPLMSRVPLQAKDSTIELLQVDFSIVSSSQETMLTAVISKLPDIAKSISLLMTPYSRAFAATSAVLNGVMETVVKDETNQELVKSGGRSALEFWSNGRCGRTGAFSGTYLFIQSHKPPVYRNRDNPNTVDLAELSQYCFMTFQGSDAVYFEKKGAEDGKCTMHPKNSKMLLNPHFTLVVEIPSSGRRLKREVIPSARAVADNPPGYGDLRAVAKINRATTVHELKRAGLRSFTQYEGPNYRLSGGTILYKPRNATAGVEMRYVEREEVVLNYMLRCTLSGLACAGSRRQVER